MVFRHPHFFSVAFQNAVNSRPTQISITVTNNIHINHHGQILPPNDNNHHMNVNNGNMIVNSVEKKNKINPPENNDKETDQEDDNEENDMEYLTPSISNQNEDDHTQ